MSKVEGKRQNYPGSSLIHYSPRTAFRVISNNEIEKDLLTYVERVNLLVVLRKASSLPSKLNRRSSSFLLWNTAESCIPN